EHGRGAAFFDLDRTLMAGSSGLYWARAARGAGLLTRRRIARYGWENVKFRLRGSTDQATDRVRREVGEMISGQRVVDLQRLAREEGWEIMRFEQLGRRLKAVAAFAFAALVGTGARTVAVRRK